MVGLGGIGYGGAIIPVVGDSIAIGVGQSICATIAWIGRTKIAGIGNAIRVSIDSIYAGRTRIAIITHAIAVSIGLKRIGFESTIIRAI